VQHRDHSHDLPHVVIVGAGFGGLAAAAKLAGAPVRVTLIDRRNHHLFQPLLYQVATAGLSPNQIATPIRTIVRRHTNTDVVLDEVTGVDLANQQVKLGARRIGYDYLVLATGARHAYFGHDDWEVAAPGLKTLDDAIEHRKRILLAFERAELEEDERERARLTTFVVVGGGPTGVELAGAIAELARKALAMDFRHINPGSARVILVEAGPRLLPAFSEELSETARRSLEKLGAEVRLNAAVTGIDEGGVTLGDNRIESRVVIWAAGVAASPAGRWTGAATDRAGRVLIEPGLTLKGHRNVFVIGDTSSLNGDDGRPLPGVAPVAKQQGAHVARAIARTVTGRAPPPPFRYADVGMLATVGRKAAVADFGGFKLRGFIGWLVWSVAHIYFLIGFRNRLAVSIDWTWSYLTFERGARLITGPVHDPRGDVVPEVAPSPTRAPEQAGA
jgi:NADH dehydrogenase